MIFEIMFWMPVNFLWWYACDIIYFNKTYHYFVYVLLFLSFPSIIASRYWLSNAFKNLVKLLNTSRGTIYHYDRIKNT